MAGGDRRLPGRAVGPAASCSRPRTGHRAETRVRVERGSATVLVVGVLAVLVVVGSAATLVAVAATATHRAATAADLAALAGAVALRDLGSADRACAAAGRLAERNGGVLVSCSAATDESVTVRCSVPTGLSGAGFPASVVREARAGPAPDT
ncbi:conserved exported hypothetical protein [Nostocoides japonicum T1-X7]|uniref:Uncharacterized protein n=1 Tax=Nostocoides japonicum T1-X7 TaxID=1194083 RepID=A0A077LTP8_9MICO|nr:conserved exported hypothetical protein [Tetrasphaera japonica T1-X7]